MGTDKMMLQMSRKILIFIAFMINWNCIVYANPVYLDRSAPIEKRVEDLLRRMTIEEKIAQMQHIHSKHYNNKGVVDLERLRNESQK